MQCLASFTWLIERFQRLFAGPDQGIGITNRLPKQTVNETGVQTVKLPLIHR